MDNQLHAAKIGNKYSGSFIERKGSMLYNQRRPPKK